MRKRKPYNPPLIENIGIDKELVFLSTSEYTPPDPGGGDWEPLNTSPNKSNNSSSYEDKNKFNENPFEK